jgi:hypothetical protein
MQKASLVLQLQVLEVQVVQVPQEQQEVLPQVVLEVQILMALQVVLWLAWVEVALVFQREEQVVLL